MMEKISLAIPVHEMAYRWNFIRRIVNWAERDDRIHEVVLSIEPERSPIHIDRPKVRSLYNETRQFVFRNKFRAVEASEKEWVMIFDSDNTPCSEYLDAFYAQQPWDSKLTYQPEFLRPYFDFRKFSGRTIGAREVKAALETPIFRCLINAMNCIVNRKAFLEANRVAYDSGYDPKCADSIFINYNMMKAGSAIKVVPGMQYDHLVHRRSFYKEDSAAHVGIVKEYERKMCEL